MNEHTKKLCTYIGMRLLEQRKKRRFTLAYLAQRVNLSPQQLQRYEGAHSTITATRLCLLAAVLCVDVNYFFKGFSDFEARTAPALQMTLRPAPLGPLNILFIEDDVGDAYLTRKALEDSGTNVNLLVMRNDVTVLRFLRNQVTDVLFPRPDLILLGLSLLKDNTLFLLRELKRDRTLSDIPIVVLTNKLNKQDMITCYTEHAAGYVYKPFNCEVFEHSLKTLVAYWAHAVLLPSRHYQTVNKPH